MKTNTKQVASAEMRIYGEKVGGWMRATPLSRAVEAHDAAWIAAETKWGIDVLPSLVSPDTAAKFGKACMKRDEAIQGGTEDEAIAKLAVVVRGLAALEAEAEAAGHVAGKIKHKWPYSHEDGTKWLFVPSEQDGRVAASSGKYDGWQIWSLPEVCRMLSAGSLISVLKAKDIMPGLQVTDVRPKPSALAVELGDEIPF